jgi:hypothetical protein
VRQTLTTVGVPTATGALGVVGGVLLARTALQRRRKLLGVPLPGVKIDLTNVGRQIGEAGRQFGRLASEVQAVREKAEKISRAVG